MKRILTISIAIFIIAAGLFVFGEIRNQYLKNNIPDPPVYEERKVSTKPVLEQDDITAKDVEDAIKKDLGVDEMLHVHEDGAYKDTYDPFSDVSEEECCPDEELIEGKEPKTRLQVLLDKLLPKGFDRADIERYAELSGRFLSMMDNVEPQSYSIDEMVEYLELAYMFEPTEKNLQGLEHFRRQKEMIDKYGGEFKFVRGTRAR